MDWRKAISKLNSGTDKKKRERWIALLTAGLFLLLFSASTSREPQLPVSAAVQDETDKKYNENGNKPEEGLQEAFQNAGQTKQGMPDMVSYEKQLEERVKELLKSTEGVGEADVMIILKSSKETILHEDQRRSRSSSKEADSAGGTRETVNEEASKNTVFVENGTEKTPIVEKELCPAVEGIVISAQGGGSAFVKTEISEAMQALFNIPAHKIKVLKRVD